VPGTIRREMYILWHCFIVFYFSFTLYHDRLLLVCGLIFIQCQSISAQDLVEDLQLLRAGKVPSRRHSRHIPPPPATPPPEPPGNGVNVREQVSVFNAAAHRKYLWLIYWEIISYLSDKECFTLSLNSPVAHFLDVCVVLCCLYCSARWKLLRTIRV